MDTATASTPPATTSAAMSATSADPSPASSATPAASGATAPGPDHFLDLRAWARDHCGLGCPVRDEAYLCALSALTHRVLKFGWEPAIERLSARDCLNCTRMVGGKAAAFFLDLAFTRALIENDEPVVRRLLASPFIPPARAWMTIVARSIFAGDDAAAEHADFLAEQQCEHLSIATLLICRHFPRLIETQHLLDCPDDTWPRLRAEIALLLLRERPQTRDLVRRYLRVRPDVRFSVDPARWPDGV